MKRLRRQQRAEERNKENEETDLPDPEPPKMTDTKLLASTIPALNAANKQHLKRAADFFEVNMGS
jgi:hypothetical protein